MTEPVMIGDIASALGLGDHELVSLVGGGGKTTVLFALGTQLFGTVVLTTTTKMGCDRTGGHEPLLAPSDETLLGYRRSSPVQSETRFPHQLQPPGGAGGP